MDCVKYNQIFKNVSINFKFFIQFKHLRFEKTCILTNILVKTFICVIILTYSCNKLHLVKVCLCSFLDLHLCSNSLSTIATISSLIILEFFPPCLSYNNNFYLIFRIR